ncbi:MAG: type II secretion system protein [Candidatus Gastranaerophilaceae bacterium]
MEKKVGWISSARQKYGFTLSDVLIALVIIGVIAAMTVPSLIQAQQNMANEAAFKKLYSNLSNAIKQVIYENGGLAYDCFTASGYSYHYSECTTF